MAHYLIVAIIDFLVGLVALSKKENKAAKALFFATFSLGFWSLELYFLTVIDDLDLLSFLFHVTRWGMFLIPPSLALLTWMLLGGKSRIFLNAVIIPGLVISIGLAVLNTFFFPSTLESVDAGYLPRADSIYYVFAANFVYCLVGSVVVGGVSVKSATFREKQRLKWLLIIMLVTLSTGLASIFLVAYDFYLKLAGATTNITFVALLFYATVQHHLMDLRLALSVGIARAVVISTVVFSYFVITSMLGDLKHSITGGLVVVLFLMVTLELYPRALRWILPNAKKLISGNSYDFEEVISDARVVLNNSIDLKGLAKILDFLVKHVGRVSDYQLFVKDGGDFRRVGVSRPIYLSGDEKHILSYCEKKRGIILSDETPSNVQRLLQLHKANACFSIAFEDKTLGMVFIGSPKDASYYRYDDIRLFEWLSLELGNVLARINTLDKMQDELGRAKKTLSMLGVMNHYHHDIKAPLAIIDGVLSNDVYAKDKGKQKDIVLRQVERGSRLIATMAGILKGERKRRVQPLSLAEVVNDSIFLFSQGIDKVDYQFSDIPNIHGDPEDLKILVINVVKNAMEARREGERLVITVSTWQSEDYICLSLRDTGTGMEPDKLEKIWENAVSDKTNGSGIGLQAIKRIADEHLAEIEVQSAPGHGSEFIFKFPISQIAEGGDTEVKQAFTSKGSLDKPMAS